MGWHRVEGWVWLQEDGCGYKKVTSDSWGTVLYLDYGDIGTYT